MSLRLSKYVFYEKINENEYVALSSITRSIAVFPSWIIEKPELIEESSSLAKDLLKTCFMVDDKSTNDDKILGFFRNIWGKDGKRMGILLAPTLNCNFACPYCYEHRNSKVMTTGTFENLKRFISSRIAKYDIYEVLLGCYGGEPLLQPHFFTETFEYISKNHPNTNTNMMMVTNGSLLTSNIHYFKHLPLKNIQVTLHGSRRFHDKQRTYISGKPSYDLIIEGIKAALETIPKTHIALRINLDTKNADSLPEVISDLRQHGLLENEKISIHPSFIQSLTGDSTSYECNCIPQPKRYGFMTKWLEELDKYGFIKDIFELKKRYLQTFITSPCSSHSFHNYVIDPDGNIGRCWSFVGNESHSVGNVNSNGFYKDNGETHWLESGFIRVKKCIDSNCPIVPICGGGCAATAFEKKGAISEPFCIKTKSEIAQLLKKYVEISKRVGLIENRNYAVIEG